MNREVMFSSNSDEWATPQDIYDSLDAEFGFNLDPCATDENHKCEKYFTKADNGKARKWGGTEYFAILHILKSESGLRRPSGKRRKTIHLLSF